MNATDTEGQRHAESASAGSLRRARWAQAAAQVVIGTLLIAAVLDGFFSVRRVSRTVVGAQGENLMRAIHHVHRPGERFTRQTLEGLVERYRDLGLRCIALLGPDRLVRSAGTCDASEDELAVVLREARPGDLFQSANTVRMIERLPPPPPPPERDAPGKGGALQPDARRPDERRHRDDRPPEPPLFLIEFVPVMASQLQASAIRSLVIGIAATLALIAATAVFWRLSRRAEHLQEALARDRRLASLGEMSAVLAHEIRNPLASLKGHAQLLAEKLESDEGERRKAERIVQEAVRLEGLCEDLLSLVRSDHVERQEVEPAALLRDAAAAVGTSSAFELDLSESPPRWHLDARRMYQVLTNLLRNASQASPQGRPARASVRAEGKQIVFTVRDFGAGVTPGDEGRIFEPFHTTRVRGTGLGLAVARRIVELHGGGITVRNHPGGGAEFRVSLPAA